MYTTIQNQQLSKDESIQFYNEYSHMFVTGLNGSPLSYETFCDYFSLTFEEPEDEFSEYIVEGSPDIENCVVDSAAWDYKLLSHNGDMIPMFAVNTSEGVAVITRDRKMLLGSFAALRLTYPSHRFYNLNSDIDIVRNLPAYIHVSTISVDTSPCTSEVACSLVGNTSHSLVSGTPDNVGTVYHDTVLHEYVDLSRGVTWSDACAPTNLCTVILIDRGLEGDRDHHTHWVSYQEFVQFVLPTQLCYTENPYVSKSIDSSLIRYDTGSLTYADHIEHTGQILSSLCRDNEPPCVSFSRYTVAPYIWSQMVRAYENYHRYKMGNTDYLEVAYSTVHWNGFRGREEVAPSLLILGHSWASLPLLTATVPHTMEIAYFTQSGMLGTIELSSVSYWTKNSPVRVKSCTMYYNPSSIVRSLIFSRLEKGPLTVLDLLALFEVTPLASNLHVTSQLSLLIAEGLVAYDLGSLVYSVVNKTLPLKGHPPDSSNLDFLWHPTFNRIPSGVTVPMLNELVQRQHLTHDPFVIISDSVDPKTPTFKVQCVYTYDDTCDVITLSYCPSKKKGKSALAFLILKATLPLPSRFNEDWKFIASCVY